MLVIAHQCLLSVSLLLTSVDFLLVYTQTEKSVACSMRQLRSSRMGGLRPNSDPHATLSQRLTCHQAPDSAAS